MSDYGKGYLYKEIQKVIYELHEKSLIITVASKNDFKDVEEVFTNHPDMILRKENITIFQVSWNHKYESILKIAEMLYIGLESIVFIDDSIFEIEMIKKVLPEATTILFDLDDVYKKLQCIYLKTNVDYKSVEVRRKTYTTNILRNDLKARSKNYEEYIESLQMKV